MPNKNYNNGSAFERKVCKLLEARGAKAYRTAGSHGDVDIIAFFGSFVFRIQCKNSDISDKEAFRIMDTICKAVKPAYYFAKPLVLTRENHIKILNEEMGHGRPA